MTGTIQIPSKGDGLKAAWGASVANGLNALMPMTPARMLVREGAGGVGCEPLPQNLRDRRAKAPAKFPFEPVFDGDGCLSSVGPGLWPYGRKFSFTVTVDSSAKVSDGFIGLEITHKTSSAPESAKIVMIDTGLVAIPNANLQKTTLPLYVIEGGAISLDLRPLMALAVRE